LAKKRSFPTWRTTIPPCGSAGVSSLAVIEDLQPSTGGMSAKTTRLPGKMPLSSRHFGEKTDIFVGRIADGLISLRTGVERLINDALGNNLRLAIATTTSYENVKAILDSGLGDNALNDFEIIAAGDIVKNKKPSPEIYNYVLEKMNLKANECVAIEDSEIGFNSSTAAGLKTLVTLSEYTKSKNFEGALVVLDHLGEESQPFQIINGSLTSHTMVSVDYIKELYECTR